MKRNSRVKIKIVDGESAQRAIDRVELQTCCAMAVARESLAVLQREGKRSESIIVDLSLESRCEEWYSSSQNSRELAAEKRRQQEIATARENEVLHYRFKVASFHQKREQRGRYCAK